MAEADKQQFGDGQDNPGFAAARTAEAAKKAGQAAATAGAEATANAAAATVQAGVETGKATAEIAAGTAAGGPWGAVISAAWAMRHTLFKVLICICLGFTVFLVAIVSLPSIVSNQVFRTDPDTFDPNASTDMMERTEDMADVVSAVIQEGYDAALAEVERIIEMNGYDYETSMDALINHGSLSPDYDVAYVFAAYSASMGQRGTSEGDMRRKLQAVSAEMFKVTYEEKQFERVIPVTYATYTPVQLTIVTGQTEIGEVNGQPRYQYHIEQRTLYEASGEASTETEFVKTAYVPVEVELPIYRYGAIDGTQTATYYQPDGIETLTPETEIVSYAEATIHPFNQGVIIKAFNINMDAEYDQFPGTTYAEAIQTMADALSQTLYGRPAAGELPTLTNEELITLLDGLGATGAREKIIETALSLVGKVPYFWGGKSGAGWNDEWNTPKKVTSTGSVTTGTVRPYGLDCSGFTDWVYKTAIGQSIGTGSASQWSKSTEISEAELLPGDLGFKAKPGDPGTNHVLIYVGEQNGEKMWVHSSSAKGGVVLNSPSYVKYYRRPNGIDFNTVSGGSTDQLGEPLYTLKVNVTHYCACAKCCGDNADGYTASGKRVEEGMVAMSSYYPFGTQLVINGELYTVEDRGGSRIEKDKTRVDIYVSDHQRALRLGRFWAEAQFYRIGR